MRRRTPRLLAAFVMLTTVIGVLLSTSVLWHTSSSAQQPVWDPVAIARAHLAAVDAAAPAARSRAAATESQDLVDVHDSQGAVHVRLQQTVNGVPIEGAVSTLSMRRGDQSVSFAIDKHAPAPVVPSSMASVSSAIAEQAAITAIGVQLPLRGSTSSHLAYQREGLQFKLVWQVSIPALTPLGDWRVSVDAQTGAVLTYNNVMQFDSGAVFDPNPYESSGHTVPPPTNCDTAPNAATLSPLRQSVTLQGITPAQNKLKGAYVDLTAPGIYPSGYGKSAGIADEASRVYNYACNDDRFEEVMVYYHVDATQRKIQSLGFTGSSAILNSPIPAHAHYSGEGGSVDCNAFYSSFDKGLHFFDGDAVVCPTDTAEDADVVVHEYGHALQIAEVPGWGDSLSAFDVEQTNSMGEGWGDFLAGAMFGDPCTGGWALNEVYDPGTHCLRDLQNANVYPTDFDACRTPSPFDPAEVHCGGLIWGGALWDLVEALGNNQSARDTALRLVLDSHFYLSPWATFNDGAAAIKQADLDLYGGAHAATIVSVFNARGINANNAIGSFNFYHLRIRHTFISDLVVELKIGSTTSPLCTEQIWNRTGDGADDLEGWVPTAACAAFFPPTVAQPWFLEASDHAALDVGYIDAFEVALPGAKLCVATDVPVNIPDGTGVPVHATVDCSTQVSALPTSTNTPTNTPTRTNTSTPTATQTPTATPTIDPTLDTDGDGVLDGLDNCRFVANPDQLNTDGNNAALNRPGQDTLGDACDPDADGDGYTAAQEAAVVPAKSDTAYCVIMRADVNGDHKAALGDLVLTAAWYLQTIPPAPSRYSQRNDVKITLSDLVLEAAVYFQNVSACP